jgi:hypothetical protein
LELVEDGQFSLDCLIGRKDLAVPCRSHSACLPALLLLNVDASLPLGHGNPERQEALSPHILKSR